MFASLFRRRRPRVEDAKKNAFLIRTVLRLFDGGLDTREIARLLIEPEACVEAALHAGLDARRNAT